MAKTLPKINVTKLSDLQDKQEDTRLRSLKEQVDSGGKLRASKRRKSKKSVEQIQAEIDERNPTYVSPLTGRKLPVKKTRAKISPVKFYALDAGLKLEEENKIQAEKITKIITIQKLHKVNHQKEKSEIAEINNVLTGIAEFIKSDYESRVQDEDSKNSQLREDESKKDQTDKEKGLEATGKKTNDKIGKQSQGIISPVKGVFQKLMDAVTAIGLGIVGNAAFKFLARPEIFEKLGGVFDFITKHFKWVLGGLGAIALIGIIGPIVAIGSAIATVVGAIAGAAVIVAKIAAVIGLIVLAIKGATDVFKWLRGDKLGDSIVSDARKDNREDMTEQGVEKAHISGIFGERYRVERDGEMVKLKYKELTVDEKAIVDQFKARDQEIKDTTKERKAEKKAEEKRIKKERKESDEHQELKAMPRGKERGDLFDAFHKETNRLIKERKNEIDKKYEEIFTARKIGGDASGLTMVGEDGPEIVDFKTAVNVVPAHRTQETLKTLGESGGTNVISMDLPPIDLPAPQVAGSQQTPSTEVEMIASVNPFNTYMMLTPELLKIS